MGVTDSFGGKLGDFGGPPCYGGFIGENGNPEMGVVWNLCRKVEVDRDQEINLEAMGLLSDSKFNQLDK